VKEISRAITRSSEHSTDLLTQPTRTFLSIVEEEFRFNRDVQKEDYLKTSADQLFASIRAVVRQTRIGILTGFEICIQPDWCPQGKENVPNEYK